ncbi:MAG: family N-acetyltransferase [Sphingobacteriaceae bacterium]|jgi:ribosomal protein S18 acetylase RimI-like enzyme|nr:family N-acetyltransferase [Sphingobacteriaceae bacterium]
MDSDNLIIRNAITADLPGILQLISTVVPAMNAAGNLQWDNNYPNEEVFKNDIAQQQLWLAEIDNTIAGIIALTEQQEPEYRDVGWDITEPAIVVHRLAVHTGFQGRGIAAALLMQAEVVAKNRNIPLVRVDTNTKNLATQKLFPKLGYEFAGEISLAFRPGLSFYCYQKELNL